MSWIAVGTAAATIGATVLTNRANKDAAKTAGAAEVEAARLKNEGIDRGIAAVKEGVAESDQLYGAVREQTQPGVNYVRDIIASPQTLTPAQNAELENLRRSVVDSSQVAGSALRGSGRSFVDAMRNVEGDFRLKALDQNRTRADQAALEFARPNFNAAGNQASAHATMGQQVGGALANQGANLGNAAANSGYNNANATTANAGNWGQAIKDIGSAVGSWQKDQTRPAKYDTASGDWTPGPGGF